MRDEIARTCGSVDAAAFDSFVDWLRKLYRVEMPNFIDRNYSSPLGLLSSPPALVQLTRLGTFGRLGAAVRRRFADPRLHRLCSFQAMYAGLSPESLWPFMPCSPIWTPSRVSGFRRAVYMRSHDGAVRVESWRDIP
jgi:hypothetical protein